MEPFRRLRLTKRKDLVEFGQQELPMTKTQAAELQTKWNQLVGPSACEHPNQELEESAGGYLTGKYHCTTCGEAVTKKEVLVSQTPTSP